MISICPSVLGDSSGMKSGMDGYLSWTLDAEGTLTIFGDELGGSIPYWSWHENQAIRKVVINGWVESIGDGAFRGCSNLISVTLDNSVKYIGANAFEDSGLREINFPNGIESIGSRAFSGCALEEVILPESVNFIGNSTFDKCENLKNIYVDEKNAEFSSIDGNLFDKAQTEIIQYAIGKNDTLYKIPEGVVSVGNNAFRNCNNVSQIIFPDGLEKIGIGAFADCSKISHISFPNSLTEIGNNAFIRTGLVRVNIPENVTQIGAHLFYGCEHLKEASISTDLKKFYDKRGGALFAECKNLEYVELGDISVDSYMFYGCNNLRKITIGTNSSELSSIIKDVKIEENAFAGLYNLTEVQIGNAVTMIGDRAFSGCPNLQSVTIGADSRFRTKVLGSIGSEAFLGCENLTQVMIGNNIKTIGTSAFLGCTRLQEITMVESVTDIQDYAFGESMKDLYYTGTQALWAEVQLNGNSFENKTIHFLPRIRVTVTEADETKIFIASIPNMPEDQLENPYIILGLYSDDGVLVETQCKPCVDSAAVFISNVPYSKGKVMLWENMNTMKPICPAESEFKRY